VKRPPSRRSVERMRERERKVGLEPDDDAARWLEEHEPKVEKPPPKAARKSKALHRWRQQRGGQASPPK
jgi:hypothetical protein